jgi:homoserine kinase type II
MARLTPLSRAEGASIGREHGLEVSDVVSLEAGSVNSNFRLATTDGGRYFLRIYEEQGAEGAARELALLGALSRAGVATTLPLARLDGGLSFHAGKPVAVYPWIEGEILCQKQVTPRHCEEVGRALAALHLATPGLGALPRGRFGVVDVMARLDRVEAAGERFAPVARAIRGRLESYRSRRDADLPRGIIHGDLFRDNVLWQGDSIAALIDFESASEGSFVFDIMVTIEAWCYGEAFELPLVQAFIQGYHRARPLSPQELDAFVVEGGIAALRFATTRITDFSMRAAPGQLPSRDYRRFLRRLDDLEGGALSAALAELGC